jgi:cytoskeletal protein RodZ
MANNKSNISAQEITDQEKLMQYLNEQLSHSESHQLESDMESDPFMTEAMEGLEQVDKQIIPEVIDQLNISLRKEIKVKKRKKRNQIFSNQNWVYFAVILILILLIISYLVMKKMG